MVLAQFSRLLVKPAGPLCANDVKVPDSLTYHLTDVYLTELEKALGSEEAATTASTDPSMSRGALLALLKPFVDTAATCHSSTVYDKILSNVIEPLLTDCLAAAQEAEEKSKPNKRRKLAGKSQADASDDEDAAESAVEYPRILASTKLSPLTLRSRIFAAMFAAASREDAVASRRRKLYTLYQEEKQRREAAGGDSEEEEDEEDE